MVYEVLVPQPGIEPSPPALEAQGPNHWTASCSVALSYPTLCDPLDCSTPGFPVLHCLLESKLVSWVGKIPWRRKRLPTPVFWPGSQRIRHDQANFTFTFSLSGPLSRWCRPTIASSAVPFSSCFQSSPASGPGKSPKTIYLTSHWYTVLSPTDWSLKPMLPLWTSQSGQFQGPLFQGPHSLFKPLGDGSRLR